MNLGVGKKKEKKEKLFEEKKKNHSSYSEAYKKFTVT